jgi:hypothetical protein
VHVLLLLSVVFYHHYSVKHRCIEKNFIDLLFFSLAIIPMSEYSTMEHVLYIHNNHSEHLSAATYDEYGSPVYIHGEYLPPSAVILPFTLGNLTNVKCSPKINIRKLKKTLYQIIPFLFSFLKIVKHHRSFLLSIDYFIVHYLLCVL